MKKFSTLLLTVMVSVLVFSSPSTVPAVSDVASEYNITNNIVLVCYFDEKVCNDVVFVGNYNGWSTELKNCSRMTALSGFDGWYVVEVPWAFVDETDGSSSYPSGKPVQLDSDGSFSWMFQSGDVEAWINKGDGNAKTARIVEGFTEEADVYYPEPGVYIYEVAYWKGHRSPCSTETRHDYHITLYAPNACIDMKPAIIGDFNNWQAGVPMNEEVDENFHPVYTYTFNAYEGDAIKFRERNDSTWSNELQYWSGAWYNFKNYILTDQEDIVFDWRDNTHYRFSQCDPGYGEEYTIILYDPHCAENPEFAPQIVGDFSGWDNFIPMVKGTYKNRDAWGLTFYTGSGSRYQIVESSCSWGNAIQYYDVNDGQWWGFTDRVVPMYKDGGIIVLDYSDTNLYRYPLCGKLIYDDETALDLNVTVKVPIGAPAEGVELVGGFGGLGTWINGVQMKWADGAYTASITATEGTQFKIRELGGTDENYICYANGSSTENFILGDFLDAAKQNVFVDFSNASRYKWASRESTPLDIAQGFYYIGTLNGWSETDQSYPFTLLDDGKTWEITLTSFQNDGWFKIAPDYAYKTDTFWNSLVCAPVDGCEELSGTMIYGGNGAWHMPQNDSIYSYKIRIVPVDMTFEIIPQSILLEGDALKIYDADGVDMTKRVNITWYDSLKTEIGSGSIIGGIEEGTKVFYSVLLDSILGKQYREILFKEYVTNRTIKTDTLLPLERIVVHGKVTAYGSAIPRAKVRLIQWLNSKYENEISVLTDANGEFSAELCNDSTEIIVSADGCMDNKKILKNLNEGGELGEFEMLEVQGTVLVLNMSYQDATRVGEEPVVKNWYPDTRNLAYIVRNLTTGQTIENYGLQQGNIVVPEGANRGDNIQVTLSSRNNKFAETAAAGVIGTNDTAIIALHLFAYGSLEVNYEQKADASLLAMLYDDKGKLQMRTVCYTSKLTFTNLEAGKYELITMGYNGAVGALSDISDLEEMDVEEGADYVRTPVTVNNGYITSVSVPSVPELDASKFEYTGSNTSYLPNKIQIVTGNFITMAVRVDFKEQYSSNIDKAKIIIDIPDGCEFVPNSVVIGTKSLPHSLNGNKLTISLTKDDIDSRIRFCMIPVETGSFISAAYTEFEYRGIKSQPIGQIQFEATTGDIFVPSAIKTSTINIGGIGVPKADVEIYDNDNLIGVTKSLADGKWTYLCKLNGTYNLSYHEIFVIYRVDGNVVGRTESKKCDHDVNAIVPKTVTMVNTAHPAGNNTPTVYESVFDYQSIMTVENYYRYWPDYPNFTFIIDLSENDTAKVSDVVLTVYTTDGDKRRLHATFDEDLGRFVATGVFYTHSRPVNVCVDYYYDEVATFDDTERSNDEYANMEKSFAKLEEYINEYYDYNTLVDEDSIVVFDVIDNKTNSTQSLNVEILNPSDLNIDDFVYVKDSTNGINFYLQELMDESSFTAIVIEDSMKSAYKIRIGSQATPSYSANKRKAPISSKSIAAAGEYVAGALIPYYDYCSGVIDYNFWRNKLSQDDDEITEERQKTFNMMMSTCADGDYKLDKAWLSAFGQSYSQLTTDHSLFTRNGYDMLEIWRSELVKQFTYESVTMGIGKVAKIIPNIKVFKTNSKNARYWQYLVKGGAKNRKRVEDMIENEIDKFGGFLEDTHVDLSISERFSSWEPSEKSNIIRQFKTLQADIKSRYRCDEDDEGDEDDDKKTESKIPIDDPSGFVYEAVPTNRVEGVTATVYYQEDDVPMQWNAAEFGQINPQITDESGLYAWDVPAGSWKVVFVKPGYETCETAWLPVPPPQLEINIPMTQAVAPYVQNAMGTTSGITLEFSKYMRPATLTANSRIYVTCNGTKIGGSLEMLDLEEDPYMKQKYASKVKFVPNKPFLISDKVVITVKKEVESYAGVKMPEDFVQKLTITSEITDIICDSILMVDYADSTSLNITVLPASAANGKSIYVESTSSIIAAVDKQNVTIDNAGKADIVVYGKLPGNASIHLSIPEAGIDKYIKVNVLKKETGTVHKPKASKLSGSTVDNDYLLTLSCATQGATIYYTLDGSCPCNEQTRTKYTTPIMLPEGEITLQAVAVREGMNDSEIATYTYKVRQNLEDGLDEVQESRDYEMFYKDDCIIITGIKGAKCCIYDVLGRELASRPCIGESETINVPKNEVYIVNLIFENRETIVSKIIVK